TVNYISLERNPNAKEIKDLASAAVLMASIGAAVIGLLVFVPKIL
ncbi:MAG: diacylglycerol kinase, partial [Faecalicoccus sp.]|nr:diacylglycerol kinase [Faecalicoccus sp.]